MITFSGYISGEAEKLFLRKARQQHAITLTIVFVSMSFAIIGVGKLLFRSAPFADTYIRGLMIALLIGTAICCLPKGKRARLASYPQLIYIENDKIVCVSESYTEERFIHDVLAVVDYGMFYQLKFLRAKHSDKFICQKDLLSRGSLEEFEQLFDGKIERCTS